MDMTSGAVAPGFWMNEETGLLGAAVMAYVEHDALSDRQIGFLRAYLRQWIAGFPRCDDLKADIDKLTSRAALDAWLERALAEGIDPL
jgi:hypothetical protein